MERIALVTGANQGLGFALVARLCEVLPAGSTVYLAARDPERGEEAAYALRARGLAPLVVPLDVTGDDSVARLAEALERRHGGVDIVISNAAARMVKDRPQHRQVRLVVETNNRGTTRMIRAFGPRMRPGGRFLVVASSFGSLRHLDARLQPLFDVASRSLDDLDATMDEWATLVERGDASPPWPDWINVPSKIGQVAAAKIFARQRPDLFVAAVCPGLIDTAASRPGFADMSAAQTPAQAAEDVVWLATTSHTAGLHGELVRHRAVLPWV
jgi:NAD(P)-dependent dehydrogenase (short-subunit alcohol dehydrogenase family)